MIPWNANEEVFADLVRLQIELWNAVDARLKADVAYGLATLEPLRVIARRDDCRVNDIADELVITIGGASKIVDRLESAGFCARKPNPSDRRSSLLAITASGAEWLARASAVYDAELAERFGPGALDAAELQQFAATLRSLRSATRKAVARSSTATTRTATTRTPEGNPS